MGHIYRCANLADKLKNFQINFLIEDYANAGKILKQKGFKNFFYLNQGTSLKNDITITKKLISKEKIDLLIIDKYQVPNEYVRNVAKYVKTAVISDLDRIDFSADLVINGFVGFKNKVSLNRYGTKCLLGPSFQVLEKSYAKNIKIKKQFHLLATFGGYDEHNLIEKLVKILTKYLDSIKVMIILGPATPSSKKILTIAKKYSNSLEIISQTKDLRKLIAKSDFGICSGGITSYEFARVGVPFAIICQHKHQIITAKEWNKLGIALNFGLLNSTIDKKIDNYIQNIIENKIYLKKNTKIVDGKGSDRIAKQINKLTTTDIHKLTN